MGIGSTSSSTAPTAHPRLVRICDPFGKLLIKSRESTTYTVSPRALEEAAEV